MNELIFLILGLWALGIAVLFAYGLSNRTSRALLQIVLGALVTLRVWGLPVAPEAGFLLALPGLDAPLALIPRLVVPAVYLIVLWTSILDGEERAAGQLLSVTAVAAIVGIGLPLLIALGDFLRSVSGLSAISFLASNTMRSQIVESMALIVGLNIGLLVYFGLSGRASARWRWPTAGLALLLAGWSEGVLSALGSEPTADNLKSPAGPSPPWLCCRSGQSPCTGCRPSGRRLRNALATWGMSGGRPLTYAMP
jgi:hypothetical protein